MSDEDVVWMGAAELGRRIAAGEVTSRQATTAYLDRIAALNPSLEAYVTVTADRALTEAAARDAELGGGHRRGPLHGVPYCLKDVIATGGIRTTAGSIILADWVPDTDATVVTRLGAAGAVLLGKVNTHEFAFGVSTQNTHARTRNPWDRSVLPGVPPVAPARRSPPVSRPSRSAPIRRDRSGFLRHFVASPASSRPLDGSVRPASSRNRIPPITSGRLPARSRTWPSCWTPLSVTIRMIRRACPMRPTDNAARLKEGVKGLRIGVPRELMEVPLQAGVAAAFEAAKEAFRELGAEVREISVPPLARASIINNAIVPPETAAQHLHWAETWFKARESAMARMWQHYSPGGGRCQRPTSFAPRASGRCSRRPLPSCSQPRPICC